MDGAAPPGALPSLSCGRVRSRPVDVVSNGISRMAESVNGGNSNPAQPPKEMSMEVRLLLAFLLMGAVMFLTPYFFKSQTPPPGQEDRRRTDRCRKAPPARHPAAPAQPPQRPASSVETAAAARRCLPAPRRSRPQPPFVIDTDLFRITFSNQGGTVRSWLLKKYKGNDDKPLELVNTAAGLDYPVLALLSRARSPPANVNWAWYHADRRSGRPGRRLRVLRRPHRRAQDLPLPEEQLSVDSLQRSHLDGKPLPSMIEWRGGFGDLTVANPAADRAYPLLRRDRRTSWWSRLPSAAKNGPVTRQRQFLLRRHRRQILRRRLPARRQQPRSQVTTFTDTVRTPLEEKPLPLRRRGGLRWRGQPLRALRRPQGYRPAEARQPQAGAGGGFRLAVHPGQAAVPDRQLVQRHASSTTSAGPSSWSPSSSTSCCSR